MVRNPPLHGDGIGAERSSLPNVRTDIANQGGELVLDEFMIQLGDDEFIYIYADGDDLVLLSENPYEK